MRRAFLTVVFVVIILTSLLLSVVTDTFTLQGVTVDSSDLEEQFGYRDANLHTIYTAETAMITIHNTKKHTQKSSLPIYLCIFQFQSGSVICSIQHNHFAIAMLFFFVDQ